MSTGTTTHTDTEEFGALADGSPVRRWTLERDGGRFAAELYDAGAGRVLTVRTTEPGLRLCTAHHFGGRPSVPCAGIALETQHFPDSPNRPEFPSTVLRPGEEFTSRTEHAFPAR